MKPILVPVDFSKPAENAARYAVHISKAIESNIFLCHSFFVPADAIGSGNIAWPLYEYSTLKDFNREQLKTLSKELETKDGAISSPSSFHPTIFYSAVAGGITDMLDELVEEKKAGLIVMGMTGAGTVSKLLFGSVSMQIIENPKCPVLLVPSDFRFQDIRKIALATDLDDTDIDVIHSLAAFAKQFDADLVVTNIINEYQDTPENHRLSEAFLKDVTNKIDYDRIYYRQVKNSDIDEGLDWLSKNGKIDMLAMIHHHKGLLSRMFDGSHTKKMAGHISIPLLVFPSGKQFTF